MPRKSQLEGEITAQMIADLKDKVSSTLTGVTILKHSDLWTKGIPDLSVSNRHNLTIWFEVKRIAANFDKGRRGSKEDVYYPKTWVRDSTVQLDLAVRLGAWYLVLDPLRDLYAIVHSSVVYLLLHSGEKLTFSPGQTSTLCHSTTAFREAVLNLIIKEMRTNDPND